MNPSVNNVFQHAVLLLGLSTCVVLSACGSDSQRSLEHLSKPKLQSEGIAVSSANEPKIDTMPSNEMNKASGAQTEYSSQDKLIPDYAVDFVGRYYTTLDCNDGYSPCSKGTAEFVLTLLADGSVYRSVLQHGKVFTFRNDVRDKDNYRRDRWEINPERTELIIHRKEGVDFYFDILDDANMVFNLAKTKSANAAREDFPLPTINYHLRKDIGLDKGI
ncbi:hypothetical protein A3K93_01210 [Acinetobacter sp. NCu2D-2]|uniref:hypothetical protein n=1 Tax=Acinetobacter sp. NCu2D-2 TaxID=1608473 RepID=UPI0007CE078F|nr:hypothetical protein [Acinetobacter sp. NCu2D-2]ANF80939.1 hypothetical protein A3K93_01210 [Acinetobacter sp. NCu2D-2]